VVRPGHLQQTGFGDVKVGGAARMTGYEPLPVEVVVGSPMLAVENVPHVVGVVTGATIAIDDGAMRADMHSRTGRNRR
jgi:hypothetical protein